jgi:hypothetical protein
VSIPSRLHSAKLKSGMQYSELRQRQPKPLIKKKGAKAGTGTSTHHLANVIGMYADR